MLDRLQPRPGSRRSHQRVGRGTGSGQGKTAGRGEKGQGHRAAGRARPGRFEGGQMPLVRRLPKRGFRRAAKRVAEVVNTRALAAFGEGAQVDVEALASRGLIRGSGAPVKLLGDGEVPGKLTVRVHRVSAAARKKIEAAGGSVELIQ